MRRQAAERNNVAAATNYVKIKTEVQAESDEEMPQSVQAHGPYHVANLGKRMLAALDRKFLTDVTILVGDEAIKFHSNIVSFASPKLAVIVKEKEPRLPDVDPRYFRLLLQIIYSGGTSRPQDVATLLEVGRVAHELQVHTAVVFCARCLVKYVDTGNLWTILDFAHLIGGGELEKTCFKMIRNMAGHVLQAEGFLKCKRATLRKILSEDTLYNVTELQLFQACVAWANTNRDETESLRASLGSALRLIRFRAISSEDFAKHVCPTGLLSTEDERDIMRSSLTGENFMPEGFSDSTKARDPSQLMEIRLFSSGNKESFIIMPEFAKISLSVFANRDTFIHGVKLRACREDLPDGSLYKENVFVSLLGEENGREIFHKASFQGEVKNGEMFSVKFDLPCEMNRFIDYCLHVIYEDYTKENRAYESYQPDTIRGESGLEITMIDGAFAPPDLHLIIADKNEHQCQ